MSTQDRPTLAEVPGITSLEASSIDGSTSQILDLTKCLEQAQLYDEPSTALVSTPTAVAEMVKCFEDLPKNPPSLYIDLEGVNLSRHGTISILQIYVSPLDKTYLVDVHTLKEEAFSTKSASASETALKDILESSSIPKVIFDVRHDSDALYAHFQIHLAGIQDLQLMELATRTFSRNRVNGLARCIQDDANMTWSERLKWRKTKERGVKLFAPEKGGSYEVFNARPLSDDIIEYCVQDVRFLPKLWEVYDKKLTERWRAKVQSEVLNRVLLSQASTYMGHGKHMALGPKGWV